MMAFRISTGFFIWDVYRWLLVFLLSALVAWLVVNIAVRRRGGRLSALPLLRCLSGLAGRAAAQPD